MSLDVIRLQIIAPFITIDNYVRRFNIIILLLTALYNDYADDDIPDVNVYGAEPDPEPSVGISLSPVSPPEIADNIVQPDSPSASASQAGQFAQQACSLPSAVTAPRKRRTHLAGGLGLAAAISVADAQRFIRYLLGRFPVSVLVAKVDEWGKSKAAAIARSAAEDFALLTSELRQSTTPPCFVYSVLEGAQRSRKGNICGAHVQSLLVAGRRVRTEISLRR
jgi:hypothetical protein